MQQMQASGGMRTVNSGVQAARAATPTLRYRDHLEAFKIKLVPDLTVVHGIKLNFGIRLHVTLSPLKLRAAGLLPKPGKRGEVAGRLPRLAWRLRYPTQFSRSSTAEA